MVYFESEKNVVVGLEARESSSILRSQAVSQIKRVMGDPEYRRTFFGQEYTPQSISALILGVLVKDAEGWIGHSVTDVVITIPAYFGRLERDATQQAGEIAGLNVISLVPEPVAAALHYGVTETVDGTTILVYDLGGETFDVSLIKMTEGSVELLAVGGDQRLGGVDWDDKVLNYLVNQAIAQFGDESLLYDEQIMRDLRFSAEEIKKTLGAAESRKHNIRFGGHVAGVTITRQQFEEMTEELLRKTLQITIQTLTNAEKVYPGIRQQIGQVLLVGGSSLMPAVRHALISEFGQIVQLADPELAVAKGAASYGAGPAGHRTETVMDAYRSIPSGEASSSSPVDSYWDVRSKSAEDFGRALTKLRQDAGLTVQQISVSAQIPASLLSEYFSGHSTPPRSVLLRDILNACGVVDRHELGEWLSAFDRLRAKLLEQESGEAASTGTDNPNLLFRIYIPVGRLYAAEADKLLSLFRDWLGSVRGHGVRQAGYQTKAGKVYEFFGDQSLTRLDLPREFSDFSGFIALCDRDPSMAVDQLLQAGLGPETAPDLVARYGKEVRRLNLDLKHERDRRVLAIRHSLESELLDQEIDQSAARAQVSALIEALVPEPLASAPIALLGPDRRMDPVPFTLNINQQVINAVEGSVIQNLQGTANLGPQAKDLLRLIELFGKEQTIALKSAVHELEDPDARGVDRVGAKRRLMDFLGRLGNSAQDVAVGVLEKYLESKIGI